MRQPLPYAQIKFDDSYPVEKDPRCQINLIVAMPWNMRTKTHILLENLVCLKLFLCLLNQKIQSTKKMD